MKVGVGQQESIAGLSIKNMRGVENFPLRIFLLIKLAGSVAELARISGVSESAIRSWRDEKSDPGVRNVVALAKATGVYVLWLVTGDAPVFKPLTESDLANLEAAFEDYWIGFDHEIRREIALVRFAADYARGQHVQRLPGILRFDLGQFSDWVINRHVSRPPTTINSPPPFGVLSENAVIHAYQTVETSLGADSGKYDRHTKEALVVQIAREGTRVEAEKFGFVTESDSPEDPNTDD